MKPKSLKRTPSSSPKVKNARKAVVPTAKRSAHPAESSVGGAKERTRIPVPDPPAEHWELRLYVLDETLKSRTALANLQQLCEAHLAGRYHITVIDLLKEPHLAKNDQILAIPTVVRLLPKPMRTLIGTLTNTESVLIGLDLRNDGQPGRAP